LFLVHSKLLIVDDCFFTCGSANMVDLSLDADHTELNISVWSPETTRLFRTRLFDEHTGGIADLVNDKPIESTRRLAEHAKQNTLKMNSRQELQGHIYQLDPNQYGASLFIAAIALERAASHSAKI
jgi:phosphatidylserine/phosphatidylglycerophosphate/cardiolipin synthase-like enzyme